MYGIKIKDTGSDSYIIVPAQEDATETMTKACSIVKLAMAACGRTYYDWDNKNGVMTVIFYDDKDKVVKIELSIVKF